MASITSGVHAGTCDKDASSRRQRWYSMSATARYPTYSATYLAISAGSSAGSASRGNFAWTHAMALHPRSQSHASMDASRASMNLAVSLPGASSGSGAGGSGEVQSSPASAGFLK